MVIQRYNTICCIPGSMELQQLELVTCEPVGAYCVDTSHFTPKCDAVQLLRAGDVSSQGFYDFPNGNDSGVNIPRSRLHSYTGDLAEASVNVREASANANDNMSISQQQYETEIAKLQAQVQSPGGSSSSSGN